jgi:3-isopropylmalate/(R)-2-methylmalate dehydratase small subunit
VTVDLDAEVTVDLDAETLTLPDGRAVGFQVDPFARRMLLEGTDELGYLLRHAEAVAAYEAAHPARVDTLAPTGALDRGVAVAEPPQLWDAAPPGGRG